MFTTIFKLFIVHSPYLQKQLLKHHPFGFFLFNVVGGRGGQTVPFLHLLRHPFKTVFCNYVWYTHVSMLTAWPCTGCNICSLSWKIFSIAAYCICVNLRNILILLTICDEIVWPNCYHIMQPGDGYIQMITHSNVTVHHQKLDNTQILTALKFRANLLTLWFNIR